MKCPQAQSPFFPNDFKEEAYLSLFIFSKDRSLFLFFKGGSRTKHSRNLPPRASGPSPLGFCPTLLSRLPPRASPIRIKQKRGPGNLRRGALPSQPSAAVLRGAAVW